MLVVGASVSLTWQVGYQHGGIAGVIIVRLGVAWFIVRHPHSTNRIYGPGTGGEIEAIQCFISDHGNAEGSAVLGTMRQDLQLTLRMTHPIAPQATWRKTRADTAVCQCSAFWAWKSCSRVYLPTSPGFSFSILTLSEWLFLCSASSVCWSC